MVVMERFQTATDRTVDWLADSGLPAIEGYLIAQLLQRAAAAYSWRLIPDPFGSAERSWCEAHKAWLSKLTDLGGPDTLIAAIQAID